VSGERERGRERKKNLLLHPKANYFSSKATSKDVKGESEREID